MLALQRRQGIYCCSLTSCCLFFSLDLLGSIACILPGINSVSLEIGQHKRRVDQQNRRTMGAPGRSDEREISTLNTGPLTGRLGYSLKLLRLEVPVVMLHFEHCIVSLD